MPRSTLTSKGQITIPKSIRDRFGLQSGDSLEFVVEDDGRVLMQPIRESGQLFGLLSEFAPSTAVTVEEMNGAIRSRAGKHSPSRSR